MRIERIKITNHKCLGTVDWRLPEDFVSLFFEDIHRQKMFSKILLELFYDLNSQSAQGEAKGKGLVEATLADEKTAFHISREFTQHDGHKSPELVIMVEDGQAWSLPEKVTLGEYVFGIGLEGFQQGGIIQWPAIKEDDFYRRMRNLRQVGDEELSFFKTRDSLVRAKKKVEEQAESMDQVKVEYEALKRDWEAATRMQEEHRLLQIEAKNLQAKKEHLEEKIASITKIQERLGLLRQNPGYRDLRRLQGELSRLEELCRKTEAELAAHTLDAHVDWMMIEGLREECLAWACLRQEAGDLADEIKRVTAEITEIQNLMQNSGYRELPDNTEQLLRQAEWELNAAQEQLDKLTVFFDEMARTETMYKKEVEKLQDFAVMAGITVFDERKITQTVRRLALWQSAKASGFIERVLKEQLGWISIEERLTARLNLFWQKYQVADHEEFKRKLQELQGRQQVIGRLRGELLRLGRETEQEKELRRIIHSRSQMIKRAVRIVKAVDFQGWLNGWEGYQCTKKLEAEMLEALHSKMDQHWVKEEKLTEYADQLREKLKNWLSPLSNIEEVLEVVMKVACKLRAKEEAEQEFTALKQQYDDLLGQRSMDQLAKILEPLADLEREACLSDEERQAELFACEQELVETNRRLKNTEKSLHRNRTTPVIPDLEKKLEAVNLQWKTYEELQRALADTLAILEDCRQKWHSKYGKNLEAKAQRILSRTFTPSASLQKENMITEDKQDYFAYRMALAQLAFEDNPAAPLFFFVGEMKEKEEFWEDVLAYLQELSLSRQVIFCTLDVKR